MLVKYYKTIAFLSFHDGRSMPRLLGSGIFSLSKHEIWKTLGIDFIPLYSTLYFINHKQNRGDGNNNLNLLNNLNVLRNFLIIYMGYNLKWISNSYDVLRYELCVCLYHCTLASLLSHGTF